MKAYAVVRESGEVGVGGAAADSVVGCSPGWREPGSVTGLDCGREEGAGGGEILGCAEEYVGRERCVHGACFGKRINVVE